MSSSLQALTPDQVQIQALTNALSILEKTNDQLSLLYNPYGLMVAALGVLFTVLAIAFAYILWKQGSDYRKIFDNFLLEQQRILDVEIKKAISEARVAMDEQIKKGEENLKNLTGEIKNNAEEEIAKLKKARSSLDSVRTSVPVGVLSSVTSMPVSGAGVLGTLPAYLQSGFSTFVTSSGICSCGNVFLDSGKFCSNCGRER